MISLASTLKAIPIGDKYDIQKESDIIKLSCDKDGLKVIVSTSLPENAETLYLEFFSKKYRGFRLLDEGDLIPYWESKLFQSGHHLYQITDGGWLKQETQFSGMISGAETFELYEWFIFTTNLCLNIIGGDVPVVRELKKGKNAQK